MDPKPLQIAVIIGSNRPNRSGGAVADWFLGLAASRSDMTFDLIDLAVVELPAVIPFERDEAVETYLKRLDAADGFVVVVPEYNHGYPAPLKQAIDLAKTQWYAKPVAFVSYGGMAGGVRAVEQLRQVFAELHAVTVRDAVGLPRIRHQFDEEGNLADPVAPAIAERMLDQLSWWASALAEARRRRPYVK